MSDTLPNPLLRIRNERNPEQQLEEEEEEEKSEKSAEEKRGDDDDGDINSARYLPAHMLQDESAERAGRVQRDGVYRSYSTPLPLVLPFHQKSPTPK